MFRNKLMSMLAMRSIVAWLVLGGILVFAACQSGGTGPLTEKEKEEIKKEILARNEDNIKAAEAADTDKFLTFLAPDFHGADRGAFYMSAAEAEKAVRPVYAGLKGQEIKIDKISVRVLSRDIAVHEELGTIKMTDLSDAVSAPTTYVFTTAWVKRNGQWLITQYHQSLLPKEQ